MGAQAVRLSNVDIDNALKNKDFEVLFQPIFDLGNGALARMESFVRWRHPNLGLLPPGAFISFFESQGRMSELTRYVLANAISAYSNWRGPFAPGLSVNLALSDLSDEAFASHFVKLLRDHDFPADLVTLECPMPPVDMSMEKASEHFKRLSDTGARLAIEVRGRANDLLRTLDPFPFDEIKTGGSAILRFARTVRGPGLSAIADLLDVANDANAAITAVGVEDQASLAALRGLGFTAAQGNHLGKVGELKDFRPHRINEVRELLELEPLSSENLAALFRTEAPSLPTTETASNEKTKDAEQKTEDALIKRLNERVAQFDTTDEAPEEKSEKAETENQTADTEQEKKAKAREKAKALMLAKRAKARDERKAAAIERAKAKAAGKTPDSQTENESSAARAPRELQERLNEAFKPSEKSAPQQLSRQDDNVQKPAAETKEKAKEAVTASAAARAATAGEDPVAQARRRQAAQAEAAPVAPPAPPLSQPTGTGSASTAAMTKSVKLSVGAASAYFQPGIRVGAPALPGAPEREVQPAALNFPKPGETGESTPELAAETETPDDDSPAEESNSAQQSTVERAMASLAPEDAPIKKQTVSEAPAQPETPSEDLIGDLHKEDAPSIDRPKPKRKKSFLRRTVIPYPTHFWPKSWKRAWRKRQANKENSSEQMAAE